MRARLQSPRGQGVRLAARGTAQGARRLGRRLPALRRGAAPLRAVALASIGKIVLLPAASALLVLFVIPGLDPLWGVALIVMAAMPTSASAFMLAGAALPDRQAVATVTLATNAISMVSVPVIAAFALALPI